jgi:hypothetical protein
MLRNIELGNIPFIHGLRTHEAKYLECGYKGLFFVEKKCLNNGNHRQGTHCPKWVLIVQQKIPNNPEFICPICLPNLSAQALHCTEVRFASLLSNGFTLINPSDWKLANRTFVHWVIA